MKFQLKPGLALEEENSDVKIFQDSDPILTLKGFSSHRALFSLASELDEDLIDEESDLTLFYYALELLKSRGLLIYKTSLVDLIPFNTQFRFEELSSDDPYQLSRFAVCRTHDGEIVLETPLCPVQVVIREQAGIALFYALKKPIEFSEIRKQFPSLSSKELRETLSLLISAKILTTTQEEETSAQWEHHDLFFHSRSRMGRSDGPYGGTYRFKGKIPPLPGIKNCPSKKTIALYCPVNKKDQLFDSVLEKRTSIREHGHDPISIEELSEFLFRCARVKKMKILDDQEFTSRPYPGGGARYELELYPVVHHCKGLPQGIYHYHPLDHQLCEISQLSESTEKFLNDARRSSGKKEYPQVLILISARFQRVSWKYQSMAYAVILKNLGVLYQTMYLMATAMELAPCALGGGNSDLFCEVIGTNYLEETSVGEFMLGSLPEYLGIQ
ncbi:MAG: SagB family peptide dehydrogenase [Rhabdochlamydiaceae bacterium]